MIQNSPASLTSSLSPAIPCRKARTACSASQLVTSGVVLGETVKSLFVGHVEGNAQAAEELTTSLQCGQRLIGLGVVAEAA